MKKTLKFVNGGLFLLSLACIFMSLVKAIGEKLTGFMILKIGFGMGLESDVFGVSGSANEAVMFVFIMILGIMIIAIIAALFSFLLKGNAPYVISLILSIINTLMVGVLMLVFIVAVDSANYYGPVVSLSGLTFVLWIGLYIATFVISIVGLASKKQKPAAVANDIYPEQFNDIHNPVQEEMNFSERRYGYNEQYDNPWNNNEPESAPVPAPATGFSGAVIGKNGIYMGKAYPLQDKTKVFFVNEGANLVLSQYEEANALAAIYYVSEYQEYCVNPSAPRTVYLASGQPLGAGREYYLPRGTEIYLLDSLKLFELA